MTPDLRCHLTSKKGKSLCNKCVEKNEEYCADALDHLSVFFVLVHIFYFQIVHALSVLDKTSIPDAMRCI